MKQFEKYNSIEEFINDQDNATKEKLIQVHNYILKVAPNVVQTFAYGIPTYKYNGKNMFHFGVYKNHIGIYPTPKPIEEFLEELKPFNVLKGTIQIKHNGQFPLELIKKIIDSNIKRLL